MAHIVTRYSYEEIAKHSAENDSWVVVNGYVYDVSHFLKNHPGGPDYILKVAGKPEAINEFNKSGQHIHSKNAWEILRKFRLGATVDKKQEDIDRDSAAEAKSIGDVPTIDWNRGLVMQFSRLGDKYQKVVDSTFFPTQSQTLKYFDNPILENLTLTPWWMIPLVWFPVATLLFYYSTTLGLDFRTIPLFLVSGWFLWGFMEWTLHKYVFHWDSKTFWPNMLHFMVHGYHHIMPMDPKRLVFPPPGTAVIAYLVYSLISTFLPKHIAIAQVAGTLVGYALYDMIHYWIHFTQPNSWMLKSLKKHHMYHHYNNHNVNYGISTKFYDIVFNHLESWEGLVKAKKTN